MRAEPKIHLHTGRLFCSPRRESVWEQGKRVYGLDRRGPERKGVVAEAVKAGEVTPEGGLFASLGARLYSYLKRAKDPDVVPDKMDQDWTPVTKNWRRTKKHYMGCCKRIEQMRNAEKYGADEQVHIWRR